MVVTVVAAHCESTISELKKDTGIQSLTEQPVELEEPVPEGKIPVPDGTTPVPEGVTPVPLGITPVLP